MISLLKYGSTFCEIDFGDFDRTRADIDRHEIFILEEHARNAFRGTGTVTGALTH